MLFYYVLVEGKFYYVLFFAILFFSVLCCPILFCAVLFCSVLLYSVLFYFVLFYSERHVDGHASFGCDITPSFIAVESRKWDNNFFLLHRTTKVTLMYGWLSITQACLCLFIARPRIRKIW
jgi:hypothetical protein